MPTNTPEDIYLPDERFYALLDVLNSFKPGTEQHAHERQRLVEVLSGEGGIWPTYCRDEADAPRYGRANYQIA